MTNRKNKIDENFKKLFVSISKAQQNIFHKSKEVSRTPKKMWGNLPLVCSDLMFLITGGISYPLGSLGS